MCLLLSTEETASHETLFWLSCKCVHRHSFGSSSRFRPGWVTCWAGLFLDAVGLASNSPCCCAREVEFEVSCVKKEKGGYLMTRSTSGSRATVFLGVFMLQADCHGWGGRGSSILWRVITSTSVISTVLAGCAETPFCHSCCTEIPLFLPYRR